MNTVLYTSAAYFAILILSGVGKYILFIFFFFFFVEFLIFSEIERVDD